MADFILKLSGEVENACTLTFEDLQAIDEHHQIRDVSRLVPGKQGDAITLESLLLFAGAATNVKWLGLHSSHDDFHASVPLQPILDNAFLIYQIDGGELPRSAGGPLRFYIPDHAACNTNEIDECANVKFVDHIEFTVEKGFDNRPEDEEEHAELHRKEEE